MTPTGDSTPDEQLLAGLRAGDESAFLTLVERYQGAFRRIALNLAPSQAVADEIVQESWTAILQALPSFEGRSSVKTWLFRIVINRAKTRAERERRTVPFSSLDSADESDPEGNSFSPDGHWANPVRRSWDEDSPEQLLLRGEMRRAIQAALEGLPPQQRTVVTLRDVEGLESPEVCNVLGISESNQRVLLHRGRVRLRAALAQYLEGG